MKPETRTLNRVTWSIVFVAGVVVFTWMDRGDNSIGTMIWFIKTSLWSMFCAIGFSIFESISR